MQLAQPVHSPQFDQHTEFDPFNANITISPTTWKTWVLPKIFAKHSRSAEKHDQLENKIPRVIPIFL